MSKAKVEKTGFYRPHERVYYFDQVMDPRTGELTQVPSLTKQQFVAECDINNILKQYSATGVLRHISAKAEMGMYQDLPDEVDFQSSLNTVRQAQEAFASLPSAVRTRFENDPGRFLEFVADPSNQDELIKLGLATDRRASKEPETAPTVKTGGEGGSPPSEGPKGP